MRPNDPHPVIESFLFSLDFFFCYEPCAHAVFVHKSSTFILMVRVLGRRWRIRCPNYYNSIVSSKKTQQELIRKRITEKDTNRNINKTINQFPVICFTWILFFWFLGLYAFWLSIWNDWCLIELECSALDKGKIDKITEKNGFLLRRTNLDIFLVSCEWTLYGI